MYHYSLSAEISVLKFSNLTFSFSFYILSLIIHRSLFEPVLEGTISGQPVKGGVTVRSHRGISTVTTIFSDPNVSSAPAMSWAIDFFLTQLGRQR